MRKADMQMKELENCQERMNSTLPTSDLIVSTEQPQGCFQLCADYHFVWLLVYLSRRLTNTFYFFLGLHFIKEAGLFCVKTLQPMIYADFPVVPEYELPSFLVLLTSAGKPLPPVCFCFSALNGYLFGNFPEPDMCVGESVSWHLFGMGNEIDIHSIYFYGNTFISRGHRTDVVNLFPATFLTAEMIAENPGKWMITCQVSDHLQGKRTKTSVEMLAMGQ